MQGNKFPIIRKDMLSLLVVRLKFSNMSHITAEQRYTIDAMKQQNYSQTAIATAIGKHKSVICRELKRNCDLRNNTYKYELAQKKYVHRLVIKTKNIKLNDAMKAYIIPLLENKLSPEQIAGLSKKNGIPCVSTERLYQYIWADKKKGGLHYIHLRNQDKRYRKRGSSKDKSGIIKDKVCISERPEIVENKERLGDLEVDTIIGKDHKGAIVTINDRATGLVIIRKLEGKNALELVQKIIEVLISLKSYLHTITSDNGKEFAEHKMIAEALNIKYYFARPYHSWERGANENLNGLIRQYIPKKTNFDDVTEAQIEKIEDDLNNRPRKRFNYQTPNEVFSQKKGLAA
jgi:IS30 family transposase